MSARRLLPLLALLGCDPGPSVIGGDDADTDAGVDATPPDAVVPTVAPEIDGQLTINEVMAANAVTLLDDDGVASDWIELYNPTDEDIPLHGYGLTDDLAIPLRSVLPAGTIVPAGGRLVVWPSFGLAAESGELGLARPDGSYIDRVAYDVQETDFAAAREPDGSDHWEIEWHATPGVANPPGAGQAMALEDVTAQPERIPAAGDLTERILGYDLIPAFGLVVSPANAAALEANPYVYVPATLIFDGRSYGPVGVRCKGQNSFEPFSAKPSLRVNVDQYVERARFFGLKDLTFNNMNNDYTMMHERLAYMVARAAGVPASRANHMLLTVNGALYGLYVNVETVKHRMLGRWFDDTAGPLFEATDVDFVPADVPDYVLESGPDDRSHLAGLAAALANPSPDAAIAAAGAHVDLDQFRTFWAMASVVGQFDSFPYSNPGDDYFVYADPGAHLTFLPWGMDESFYSGAIDVTVTHSVLSTTCKASPACFQAYADATWALLAQTEQLGLLAEFDRVRAEIAPLVALDQNKWYTTDDVTFYQGGMRWFISGRRAKLETMLPPPSP